MKLLAHCGQVWTQKQPISSKLSIRFVPLPWLTIRSLRLPPTKILALTTNEDLNSRRTFSKDKDSKKPWDIRVPLSLESRVAELQREVEDLQDPQPGRGWSAHESRFELLSGPDVSHYLRVALSTLLTDT